MKSVLVIGAGIGGIATAARLARSGCQVTVLEKCGRPGGRVAPLEKDGHQFICGPTLYLMPEIYSRTFADLGERVEDHLELLRVDPSYHLYFKDGARLALTADLHEMRSQLEALEEGSFGAFMRYLDQASRHYDLALRHLVERDFRNLFEYASPKNVRLFFRLNGLARHHGNIGRYFRDERLKAAFTFQDMYVGLSPYQAPALFSLLQYSEFAHGVWFPMGGMYRVIEALASIAQKLGVRFQYNAPVVEINVNGRRASGVTLEDGRVLTADVVVANADLPYVYRHLLPDDGMNRRLSRKRYSCSALMYCWGVKKQFPGLATHSLFVSGDVRESYERVVEDLSVSEDPSFYLHAPSRLDPSLAPQGEETITVIVPVGHIDEGAPQDWDAIRETTRRAVIRRLSLAGLRDFEKHIKFELSFTPYDWRDRFNLLKGATHGLSHDLMQMGYLRPRNRHKRYGNLYFVGASTHPGTGLPTVLVSARLVSERILEEQGAPRAVPKATPAPVLEAGAWSDQESLEIR